MAKNTRKRENRKNTSSGRRHTRESRQQAAKKRSQLQPWTHITGLMHVFGNERRAKKGGKPWISYATTLGKKEDGEWNNMYVNVGFRKGEDPDIVDGFDINVKDGFLSFDEYENRDGDLVRTPKVVIMEYELIDTMEQRYNRDEDDGDEDDGDEDDGDD